MASYTGNLNLKKPALDDDALITDINNNMDILDAAVNGIQDGLAIVANGNTHVAITAGQFVYVRNHSTLTEGLYVASTNIAANATLSSSNLTADAAGGLNALNNNLSTISGGFLFRFFMQANGDFDTTFQESFRKVFVANGKPIGIITGNIWAATGYLAVVSPNFSGDYMVLAMGVDNPVLHSFIISADGNTISNYSSIQLT